MTLSKSLKQSFVLSAALAAFAPSARGDRVADLHLTSAKPLTPAFLEPVTARREDYDLGHPLHLTVRGRTPDACNVDIELSLAAERGTDIQAPADLRSHGIMREKLYNIAQEWWQSVTSTIRSDRYDPYHTDDVAIALRKTYSSFIYRAHQATSKNWYLEFEKSEVKSPVCDTIEKRLAP